jgi:hypothetical protein
MAKQEVTETNAVSAYPEREPVEFERYSPLSMQTWEDANAGAVEFPGYDLLTEDRTDALENVPFLIVGATYRPGIERAGRTMSYVSVEAMVAPAHLITRRGIDPASLPFDPESHVVFNDGSTGIYRQITAALEGTGHIKLGSNGTRDNAKMGESVFDQPPGEWEDVRFGDLRFDEEGRGIYYSPIRIRASRGLRLSEYENDYTNSQSKTRYIA